MTDSKTAAAAESAAKAREDANRSAYEKQAAESASVAAKNREKAAALQKDADHRNKNAEASGGSLF
jgi:hypothetical protein